MLLVIAEIPVDIDNGAIVRLSGKPDIEYRLADHVRYLDAFLDDAGVSSAFVVAQDWGTARDTVARDLLRQDAGDPAHW